MERKIKLGADYWHFKGFKVKVLMLARHTETKEDMVVYICHDGIYVRPLEMFMSKVDRNKYPEVKQTYRFEEINYDT